MAHDARFAPRRRRRGVPLLAITLIVLLGLLVVADRVAANVAADRIRTQLVAELDERNVHAASTDVSVSGFPFLTQVAQGHYEKITIDMRQVNLSGTTLPSLFVVARGVEADTADLIDGTAKVSADQVSGSAMVDWATLATLVNYARFGLSDVTFSSASGALRVRGSANLAGSRIPMSAVADLSVNSGVVRLRVRDAQVEGSALPALAQAQLDSLVARLSVEFRIPPLPFRLSIDDVRVEQPGLSVTASARSVPLVS